MPNNASPLDEINKKTRELAVAIEESVAGLAAQIASLNDRYRSLTGADIATVEVTGADGAAKRGRGRPSGQGAEAPAKAQQSTKPKRRVRRDAGQLKGMADSIVAFIKKGGAEGVKGAAIRAEFGPVLPSIKEFVKQHTGKAVKTKGQKAAMTYHGE
jgi:hypothetical protein